MKSNNFEFLTEEDWGRLEARFHDRANGHHWRDLCNDLLTEKAQKGFCNGKLYAMKTDKDSLHTHEAFVFTGILEEDKVECDHTMDIGGPDFIVGEVVYRPEHCPKCEAKS